MEVLDVDSLADANGDLIYERTIGLVVGDTIQYKFINGNSWSDPCDVVVHCVWCWSLSVTAIMR